MTDYFRAGKRHCASGFVPLSDTEQCFESHAQAFLRHATYETLSLFGQRVIHAAKSRKFEEMGHRLTLALTLKSAQLSRDLKAESREKVDPHFLGHLNQ